MLLLGSNFDFKGAYIQKHMFIPKIKKSPFRALYVVIKRELQLKLSPPSAPTTISHIKTKVNI